MAGIVENPTAENDTVYESNLRFAVEKFKEEGIIGIIEPINKYALSNYYLNCFDKGTLMIRRLVGSRKLNHRISNKNNFALILIEKNDFEQFKTI